MNTLEQSMQALESANQKRLAAANVKRQIAAGKLTVADALSKKDARSAKVVDLLTAERGCGTARAEKLLSRAGEILWGAGGPRLTATRHVGDLSDRAREALVEALVGERCP